MKLLIKQFSPTSCLFNPLWAKYSPQHSVFKQICFLFGLNECIGGWTHRERDITPKLALQPSALSRTLLVLPDSKSSEISEVKFLQVTCDG
jgi:hypothetical protein